MASGPLWIEMFSLFWLVFEISVDGGFCLLHNLASSPDAGWSSWQLVGLITRRSQVQVLLPQPSEEKAVLVSFSGV